MAKKQQTPASKTAAPTPIQEKKQSFQFNIRSIVPLAVCLLYFAVHFIPDMGGYDAMGAQWNYMVALDFVVILFILSRDEYKVSTVKLFRNTFSKLYLAFFALAGISIFTAINPTESWVCYARLIATIVAYFNISILLQGRTDLFKILAQTLGLILLYESYDTISKFREGFGSFSENELIMSLKGMAGNKNIFAAGLVAKLPFVLYGIHTYKLLGKLLNTVILIFASIAIFIVNARATYLSLFLIIGLYFAFCVILYLKEKKMEQALYRVGFILIPVIIAFFVAQFQLSTLEGLQDQKNTSFGSVTERLASVAKTDDESNQVRFRLWQHAIDYTGKHPFTGCGVGNWKIASIIYQRTITNDLYVPIHAHNDYLEVFAELGILGGLIYLSIFVCIVVFTWKTFYSKASEETKLISVFSFIAFTTYAVDALFNFPLERPISQVFFSFLTAVNVGAYIKGREEQEEEKPVTEKAVALRAGYSFIAMLFLIPSFYVTYSTYKSLIVQKTVLADINNEPLKLDWKVVVSSFPSIPNLTATAQPVDGIKGRYVYEAGKFATNIDPVTKAARFNEALHLLTKARDANPYIGYSEFLKAGLYFEMKKFDSALINAKIAFDLRPKAKTYFQTLMAILSKVKDTTGIKKAFIEFDKYRHWAYGYNMYLQALLLAGAQDTKYMLSMADSALKMFPTHPEVPDLHVRRQEILNVAAIIAANKNGNAGAVTDFATASKYYTEGVATFGSGKPSVDNLEKAASLFLKAFALTNDYHAVENAAICFFNMGQYAKAIVYFDKELALKISADGKPEYFKGVALINLGKRDDGCSNMQVASKKGYAAADAILKSHCGK
jgi:O-antigen ligase/tetratricopeptide (TPR) repeat protein